MVALLCFCCDHRNPADAKFCNACGASLNLKPCLKCEAINTRAAAHCHSCGETFDFNFRALDDAAPSADGRDAAERSADHALVRSSSTVPARAATKSSTRPLTLVLGVTVTVLLTGWYAHRQQGRAGDVVIERPATAMLPSAVSAASPTQASLPLPAPSAVADVKPPTTVQHNAEIARKAQRAGLTALETVPAMRQRSVSDQAKRLLPTSVRKLAPDATRRRLSSKRSVTLAQGKAKPAATSARTLAGRGVAAPRYGAWDRPCAEGVALDPACDVRTMAKGN